LAEEVGVEPTRRGVHTSLVLKTRRPTRDIALPIWCRLEIYPETFLSQRSRRLRFAEKQLKNQFSLAKSALFNRVAGSKLLS